MQKILIIIGAILFLVLVAIGIYQVSQNSAEQRNSTANEENSNPSESLPVTQNTATEYSFEEVAQRNSKENCWTIINGAVYDITAYIPRHPGGDEILLACGTDGTTLFTQRTSNDGERIGSGTPHSGSATRQLESYRVGILAP